MSHDRGCPCGKEKYEYDECTEKNCFKKNNKIVETYVELYRKSTKNSGHGDPVREEFLGTVSLSLANDSIKQNRDNFNFNYYIKNTQSLKKNFKKQFDVLVFVARAQPFHNGHEKVINEALEKADTVVVVLGSSFAARSIRNPFTFQERKEMIDSVFGNHVMMFKDMEVPRVLCVPVSDYPYDDNKWINAVQTAVDNVVGKANKIGLIGHAKDHTSYYLNIFPKWKNHVEVENYLGLNATDIRENYLDNTVDMFKYQVPEPVDKWLETNYGKFDTLRKEYQMIKKYKEAWKAAPFPPTFMTVDAIVIQSGHVLLVKRKEMPGAGLFALPGGFLNQNETMLDGAIRELKEETKIKVPIPVLKGSIKESKTFDAPNRSSRGRTITQAFFIDLGMQGELPKVKGSDDAEVAFWIPFNEVKQEDMFEDHFSILSYFLGLD